MFHPRRKFLGSLFAGLAAVPMSGLSELPARAQEPAVLDLEKRRYWMEEWEKSILKSAGRRYCNTEMGEELGWLVSPFLNGFHYGYLATEKVEWVERLMNWADACVKRAVKEPDGFRGWPKDDGSGRKSDAYISDNLLGEAMMLRPILLMAQRILHQPGLKTRWGHQASAYIDLSKEIFEKWDVRKGWRDTDQGGVWVVPAFGMDRDTGKWTSGYEDRGNGSGISHPANKQNHIARWLLTLYEVTGEKEYRLRAEKWFRVMKSRMRLHEDDQFFIWNYWDPAGAWDYDGDGKIRHWVGVHPNGGYYHIDVEGMITAYESELVFDQSDVNKLIATNRDYMWNQRVENARFRRIDGGEPDPRWKNTPGVLWTPLLPYDETLKSIFLANHQPASWGGIGLTPWYVHQFS